MTPAFPTRNALEWGGVLLYASFILGALLVAWYCVERAWERRIDRIERRRLFRDDRLHAAAQDWRRQ